jgi:hypothetical protein
MIWVIFSQKRMERITFNSSRSAIFVRNWTNFYKLTWNTSNFLAENHHLFEFDSNLLRDLGYLQSKKLKKPTFPDRIFFVRNWTNFYQFMQIYTNSSPENHQLLEFGYFQMDFVIRANMKQLFMCETTTYKLKC